MKQEVRRGRKFVEYHDPETQDEFTFTQEISGADVSYQETDGSWHPADENWATDGADGFVLKNDKLNHKVRLNGKGGRTWYPRRNVNTEYMTFGIPEYWNGKRWTKFSFSGWSVEGKTITLNTRQGVTILVHNRWNGIKIDWVLASSAAPSRMRYAVTLTGITYVDGIIYGADGTRLGQLMPTTATDANGAELVCSGSYAGGYVEFQADISGAVYPVTIDPDFTAAANNILVSSYKTTSWSDAQTIATSSTVGGATTFVGTRKLSTPAWYCYRPLIKFDTSTIGSGSTVTQVNLKMVATLDNSTGDFDVQIVKYDWSAYDADQNNTTRNTAFNGVLTGTADDAIWRNTNGMSTNTQYASGNLSTAWVSKTGTTYYGLRSDMDFTNTEPPTAALYNVTLATEANATESYRPVLTVTYTAGATGALRRTNMNAQMQSLTGGFN